MHALVVNLYTQIHGPRPAKPAATALISCWTDYVAALLATPELRCID